jgi:hypothetical protein
MPEPKRRRNPPDAGGRAKTRPRRGRLRVRTLRVDKHANVLAESYAGLQADVDLQEVTISKADTDYILTTGTWQILAGLVQNAFCKANLPSLERSKD